MHPACAVLPECCRVRAVRGGHGRWGVHGVGVGGARGRCLTPRPGVCGWPWASHASQWALQCGPLRQVAKVAEERQVAQQQALTSSAVPQAGLSSLVYSWPHAGGAGQNELLIFISASFLHVSGSALAAAAWLIGWSMSEAWRGIRAPWRCLMWIWLTWAHAW